MRYLSLNSVLLIAIAINSISCSLKPTTDFFNKEVGSKLSYETYSGYEDINWYFPKGLASMYYSLWQGYSLPWTDKSVPLIIWLQGGPGGASQFGCFNEVGPLQIKGKKGSFKVSQKLIAWNFFGHLICIDQPVGVGFSYNNHTQKVTNSKDAANHLINFLSNFYANNIQLNLKTNPLYIAGESYAGHYILALADKIKSNSSLGFNLKGIMIGDGWVDPLLQINNYDSYLSSAGIVSNQWRDTTTFMQNQAITRITNEDMKQAAGYINFIIADDDVANKYYYGMNVLNYKQYDEGNINPFYADYLQQKKGSFGVPQWMNYVDDNQKMYYQFSADLSSSYRKELEKLLNQGVKTLIYNGQNDFIVNTPGVLAYLNALEWNGAKQWRSSSKRIWSEFGSINLGWYKRYNNLNFVMIRNAGHLAPSDQPKAVWAMLNNYFLNYW